jgi:hypothetical protein
MSQTIFPIGLDFLFQGNVSLGPTGSLTLPANSVGNAQIPAVAGVSASKIANFPVAKDYSQSPGATGSGTAIVADSKDVHVGGPNATGGGGIIDGIQMAITGALPQSTATVTVDVQKASAGGTSYATILSATVVFSTSSAAAGTVVQASLATTTYTAGDKFRVIVTLGGSGTQGQGLLVGLRLREPMG